MKLPLPAICRLPIVPGHRGELLSPSPPNSVCDRKKTSLCGWLPLPQAQHVSPDASSSSLGPTFPLASLSSVDYSNSK